MCWWIIKQRRLTGCGAWLIQPAHAQLCWPGGFWDSDGGPGCPCSMTARRTAIYGQRAHWHEGSHDGENVMPFPRPDPNRIRSRRSLQGSLANQITGAALGGGVKRLGVVHRRDACQCRLNTGLAQQKSAQLGTGSEVVARSCLCESSQASRRDIKQIAQG